MGLLSKKPLIAFVILVFAALISLSVVLVERRASNVLHPALDALAKIPLSERWSHPEMLKIRGLGSQAVPDLRRVLAEGSSLRTRSLLWLGRKWPNATNYISNFPYPIVLHERRWVACQAIQNIGAAAHPAFPELVHVFRSGDIGDWNAASMALYAVGIDAEIAEHLTQALEQGAPDNARPQIIRMLGRFKPPSPRTVAALTAALTNESHWVQQSAVEVIGQSHVSSPEIATQLRILQTNSHSLLAMTAAAALWDLEKQKEAVLGPVFQSLEVELRRYRPPEPTGGHGGQGVDETEQLFMQAGNLFARMPLRDEEKAKALDLLHRFTLLSGRIFVRMLLLPEMLKLGYPAEKGVEVCRAGLGYTEEYYRLQAAGLLAVVSETTPVDAEIVDELLRDTFVGVRVYGATIHWRQQRDASKILPGLIDALNRAKYQSYYYPEIQRAALSALRMMGREASASIPDLEALQSDPDPNVVQAAIETLRSIQR